MTTSTVRVPCDCCNQIELELVIAYDWSGTGQRDLDTKTSAFGQSVGYACCCGGIYVNLVTGDNTSSNAYEQVNVAVDTARANGLWSSSYNIYCYAGWYQPAEGSGPAQIFVEYNGSVKSKTIHP